MADIVTRAGKGSPLTFAEVDANFTNLNDDKLEISGGDASATVVTATGSTTARSLANRAADVVNVKDFGAVGDGVTDDTAAINAATASAADSVVLFPPAEYNYTFSQPAFGTAWCLPYTNTNFTDVGFPAWGNAVAKTSNLYFPDGPHSGEMNAAQLISLRAKGSGANGPNSGDYALVINAQKENWPNGDVGEIGGLYFKVVQGVDSGDGPSDSSCILADIYQSEDTGFSCLVEATNGVVSRSTNQFIKKSRVFLLPLDETAGSKDSYGFSVIAELGTHDDAILIQDTSTVGTWSSVIRSNNAVGTVAIKHRKTTSSDMILEAARIGVGTETPDAKLTVAYNSGAQITATDGAVGQFVGYCAGGAIAYSGTATNHPLAFLTNNTERMRIDASGNVGIGTITPGSYGKLSVAGSGTVLSQIVSDNTGEGQLIFNSVVAGRITVTGAFPLILQTNNVERMRVTGEGNVGIATSTPNASAILDVSSTTGGVLFPRLTTTQRDAISSPANGLVLYNTTTDKLQVRAAGSWVDLH